MMPSQRLGLVSGLPSHMQFSPVEQDGLPRDIIAGSSVRSGGAGSFSAFSYTRGSSLGTVVSEKDIAALQRSQGSLLTKTQTAQQSARVSQPIASSDSSESDNTPPDAATQLHLKASPPTGRHGILSQRVPQVNARAPAPISAWPHVAAPMHMQRTQPRSIPIATNHGAGMATAHHTRRDSDELEDSTGGSGHSMIPTSMPGRPGMATQQHTHTMMQGYSGGMPLQSSYGSNPSLPQSIPWAMGPSQRVGMPSGSIPLGPKLSSPVGPTASASASAPAPVSMGGGSTPASLPAEWLQHANPGMRSPKLLPPSSPVPIPRPMGMSKPNATPGPSSFGVLAGHSTAASPLRLGPVSSVTASPAGAPTGMMMMYPPKFSLPGTGLTPRPLATSAPTHAPPPAAQYSTSGGLPAEWLQGIRTPRT
jgi:hypothetical protein